MQEGAKRRLAGAVVIVALAVIFVPMLFEEESLAPPPMEGALPDEPALADPFETDSALPAAEEAVGVEETAAVEGTDPALESEPPELPAPETDFEETDESEIMGEPGQLGLSDPPARVSTGAVAKPSSRAEAPPAAPRAVATPKPEQSSRAAQPPKSDPSPKPPQTPKPVQPSRKETPAEVPEPPARPEGTSSWVVQVSSLGSSEAAANLAGKLKQSGFQAFVEKADVGGKTYYRVRVGPDGDRANAERTAAMLRQKQKLDTLIQRYP